LLLASAGACSKAVPPPGASTVLVPPGASDGQVHGFSVGTSRIVAVPNPVPEQPGVATTTVSWTAPGSPLAEVRVSEDGGPDHVFARAGGRGSAEASFIVAAHTYVFRLYRFPGARQILAAVVVRERGTR
jgi:hypothetical protein